jgi:hypothetical protein
MPRIKLLTTNLASVFAVDPVLSVTTLNDSAKHTGLSVVSRMILSMLRSILAYGLDT